MNEIDLEQLAIKELLREAEAHTRSGIRSEPKINKLVKPNKKFLSNTLNAVMNHNKREEARTQKNCRKKLKKLEDRRTARLEDHEKQHYSYFSSSDSDFPKTDNKYSRKRSSEPDNGKQYTKKRKIRHTATSTKVIEAQRAQYEQEEYYAKYFSDLAAYALASESYNQVGKWLCYQALLAGSCESYEQDCTVPYEYLTQHGIEVLEPLATIKENTISLSSDDEIKEELDLDNDVYLEATHSPAIKFETVQLEENCISLDSDDDVEEEVKDLDATIDSTKLLNEELNSLEAPDMQTIELSDSSDNEDTDPCRENRSIDLTSD